MEDGEPCPHFAGLATEGSDCGYAGEIEQDKEHEREGCQGCETCGTDVSAVEDSERGDDRFLSRQTGDETDGHLPVEAKRLQERRDELTDRSEIRVLKVVEVLRREILECPDDDRCPEDDRADLLQVVRYALPDMGGSVTRLRHTELRQLIDGVIVILPEPFGALHDDRKKDRKAYTYRIKRDHDKGFVILEECIHEQHIDR